MNDANLISLFRYLFLVAKPVRVLFVSICVLILSEFFFKCVRMPSEKRRKKRLLEDLQKTSKKCQKMTNFFTGTKIQVNISFLFFIICLFCFNMISNYFQN